MIRILKTWPHYFFAETFRTCSFTEEEKELSETPKDVTGNEIQVSEPVPGMIRCSRLKNILVKKNTNPKNKV